MEEREKEWISAREAAVIKGVSRRAVYDAIRTGKVVSREWDGRWQILRRSLDAWDIHGHRPEKPPR